MRTALVIIGENNIPPERMGTKFVEIAEQYKVLKGSTAPIKQGDPAKRGCPEGERAAGDRDR